MIIWRQVLKFIKDKNTIKTRVFNKEESQYSGFACKIES